MIFIVEELNNVIDSLNLILSSKFYNIHYKEFLKIKDIIMKWVNNSLSNISCDEMKDMDMEITDLFDYYVSIESVDENYFEQLYFYYGIFMKKFKNCILEGNE